MTENDVQDVNLRKLYCKRIGMSNNSIDQFTDLPIDQLKYGMQDAR